MKKALKILAILAALFCVAVVGVYFYVTSSGFLQKHVLPKVSEAAGMSVDAEKIKLSPFRRIELHNVTIGGEAEAADVKMRLVRVRYQMLPLLKQKLRVSDVTVVGENGTRAPVESKDASTHDGLLHVRNVTVNGLSGRYTVVAEGAPPTVVRFEELSVAVPDLRDGAEFTATVNGKVHVTNDQVDARSDAIDVKVDGTLSSDLQPDAITVAGTLANLSGKAGTVDLAGRSARIDAKLKRQNDAYEVEQLAIRELSGETEEAVLTVLGTVNPLTMDADLAITADLPNAGLLNLAGGLAGGFAFGDTRLHYQGQVKLGNAGTKIDSEGTLTVQQLTVSSTKEDLPELTPLDVQCDHRIAFDQSAGQLDAETLVARVRADGADVVTLKLDKPTSITHASDEGTVNASPATLSLNVDKLDLALFAPLIPPSDAFRLLGGKLSNTVEVTIADAGKTISARGSTRLDDVAVSANGTEIKDLAIRKEFDVAVKDLKEMTVNSQKTTILPDGKTEAIQFAFAEPARLLLGPEVGFADDAPGKFVVKIDDLVLALAKPFIATEGFELIGGKATGDLTIEVTGTTKRVAAKGDIGVRGLHVKASGQEFANLDIIDSLDVTCQDMDKIGVISNTLRIAHAPAGGTAADVAVLQAQGALSLTNMAGAFDLRLSPTGPALLALLRPFLGDIELGDTSVAYVGAVKLAENSVSSDGAVTVTGLTVASKELGLAPITPLQSQFRYDATYGVESGTLRITRGNLGVRGPRHLILAAGLSAPLALALSEETVELPDVPATVRINDLDLALIKPLIPAETGLLDLTGTVAGKIEAIVSDGGKAVHSETQLRATGLSFDLKDTGRLVPVDVGLAATATYLTTGLATLESGKVTLRQGNTELADLAIIGRANVAGEKLTAEAAVSSTSPMDLGKLEGIFIPAGAPGGEAPAPLLRDFIAKDLVAEAKIDGDKIEVSEASVNVAGGDVKLNATIDLTDPEKPDYKGLARIEQMPLAPYLRAFAPQLPVTLSGALKQLAVQFDGQGFETEQLLQQLLANAQVDVSRLAVESTSGLTGVLIEQLLMSSFDLSLADLDFKGGGGRVSYDKGMLHIPKFTLTADDFRLSGGGTARVMPGFLPGLSIVPSFRGELAESLLGKGINLTEGDDGFFAAPAIPLNKPFDDKAAILSMAVDYGVKIGKLDPKYKQISDGLNILKTLGGGQGGTTEGGGQPPKADQLLKGVLDVLQPPTPAEQQPPTPEKPATEQTTPADPVKGILNLLDAGGAKKPDEKKPTKEEKDAAKREAVNSLIRGFLGQ